MAQSDAITEAVRRHADLILRASGSTLKHYKTDRTRRAIMSAVMGCYEEAYRAGADFATKKRPSPVPGMS